MAENPQAFPCLDNDGYSLSMRDPGMTLLDYFAGQALAAMTFIKGDGAYSLEACRRNEPERDAELAAKAAYRYAAAMLKERQSHEG